MLVVELFCQYLKVYNDLGIPCKGLTFQSIVRWPNLRGHNVYVYLYPNMSDTSPPHTELVFTYYDPLLKLVRSYFLLHHELLIQGNIFTQHLPNAI